MSLQDLETKFGVSLAGDAELEKLLEMYCECKQEQLMAGVLEGEEVTEWPGERTGGMADIFVKLFTEKLLPILIEKYGDQFIQLIMGKVMEWIMNSLKPKVS